MAVVPSIPTVESAGPEDHPASRAASRSNHCRDARPPTSLETCHGILLFEPNTKDRGRKLEALGKSDVNPERQFDGITNPITISRERVEAELLRRSRLLASAQYIMQRWKR